MSTPARRPVSGGRGPGPGLPDEEQRAPTEAEWAAMSPAERDRVEDWLLESDSLEQQAQREEAMAEGERHLNAKVEARDTLREFFKTQRPGLFVAADIPVYYPGQKSISPDLIAVTDVDTHPRESWLVTREGKGIEFALEIRHKGKWRKDFVDNVARYAGLGIREYFAFDVESRELRGWRLRPGASVYGSLRGPWGRFNSEVLGLDLLVADGELRFFLGNAELLGGTRLVNWLQTLARDACDRAEAEAQRAEAEAQRAEAEAGRAASALSGFVGVIVALLRQRGMEPSAAEEARLREIQDPAELTRLAARAVTVGAVGELFA